MKHGEPKQVAWAHDSVGNYKLVLKVGPHTHPQLVKVVEADVMLEAYFPCNSHLNAFSTKS